VKLQSKPVKPKKRKVLIKEEMLAYDYQSLDDVINNFNGFDLKKVCLTHTPSYNDFDSCELNFVGYRAETPEEYEKKLADYEDKLRKYNEWYKANKVEIRAQLKSEEDKERELEIQDITRKIEKLDKFTKVRDKLAEALEVLQGNK